MDWWQVFCVIAALAVVLMLIGLPIAASLGLVGAIGLFFAASPKVMTGAIDLALSSSARNFTLVAIPMFVLMAEILNFTDSSARLFRAASSLFGGTPGSLLLGSRLTTTVFSAVTGSSIASSATIGAATIPEMVARGYDRRLTVGSVAAGGALAIVMPPSIVLVVYGFVAEVSIARLFLAGIVPALVIATLYLSWNLIIALLRPDLAPRLESVSLGKRLRALLEMSDIIILAAAVLGGIYLGITTVTEASVVGVAGALVIALANGRFSIGNLYRALLGTARIVGFVFMIVVGSLILGFLLSYLRIPAHATAALLGLDVGRWYVLGGIILVLLLLGTFMDVLAILLVAVPIIIGPLRSLGFDPIWLGIVLTIVMEMELTTPPFGVNLFVVQGVAQSVGYPVSYADAVRGAAPYLIADAVALAIVLAFPEIVLWLPALYRG